MGKWPTVLKINNTARFPIFTINWVSCIWNSQSKMHHSSHFLSPHKSEIVCGYFCQRILTSFKTGQFKKYFFKPQESIYDAYLCFDKHTWWQIGCDLLKGHMAVGMLQKSWGCMGAMNQDYVETMAMTQVTQLACKIHISWKRKKKKKKWLFATSVYLLTRLLSITGNKKMNLQDTSTTVAGAVWVSAKRRRLCRSLSSAAFLAVALMCATVTCKSPFMKHLNYSSFWTVNHYTLKPFNGYISSVWYYTFILLILLRYCAREIFRV